MHGHSSLPINGEVNGDFMKDIIRVQPKAYKISSFDSGWEVHSALFNFRWWLCGCIYQGMASLTGNVVMHSSNSCSWSTHVTSLIKNVKP